MRIACQRASSLIVVNARLAAPRPLAAGAAPVRRSSSAAHQVWHVAGCLASMHRRWLPLQAAMHFKCSNGAGAKQQGVRDGMDAEASSATRPHAPVAPCTIKLLTHTPHPNLPSSWLLLEQAFAAPFGTSFGASSFTAPLASAPRAPHLSRSVATAAGDGSSGSELWGQLLRKGGDVRGVEPEQWQGRHSQRWRGPGTSKGRPSDIYPNMHRSNKLGANTC